MDSNDQRESVARMHSGWAYLNIADPLVAWLVYRGEMFSADMVRVAERWTPLSIFHANRLRTVSRRADIYQTELGIERVRAGVHPDKASRLRGFYLFGDEESAQQAEGAWDGSFRAEYLCEVGISPGSRVTRYDSTWITQEFMSGPGTWMNRYVEGEPYGRDPLWEYVVEGTAFVYGSALRERAYETVSRKWPEALAALELGRIAAALGSSLGRTVAFPAVADEGVKVRYILDMQDAHNPDFLDRFGAFVNDPNNPVNRKDLAPISDTAWFRAPDLRDRDFFIGRT